MDKQDMRKRAYTGKLWVETESYDVYEKLELLDGVFHQWGYILHDKDIGIDGQPTKPHYHWVGYRNHGVSPNTIVKQMGLKDQDVEWAKHGWRAVVQYLTHFNDPQKYQYTVDRITSNFDHEKMFIDDVTSEDMAREIFNYLAVSQCYQVKQFVAWCMEHGFWSECRRCFSLWNSILKENTPVKVNE